MVNDPQDKSKKTDNLWQRTARERPKNPQREIKANPRKSAQIQTEKAANGGTKPKQ